MHYLVLRNCAMIRARSMIHRQVRDGFAEFGAAMVPEIFENMITSDWHDDYGCAVKDRHKVEEQLAAVTHANREDVDRRYALSLAAWKALRT